MEHRNADVRPVAGYGASRDDDTARFLHELRQLRSGAGLGHAQLAARAHYPYAVIKAAEAGPSLPDLPVLSAFVRGCGGTTEEWEERWRSLTRSPSLPVSESRQTGQSDAATAGARINSAAPAGEAPDPSVIMAALDRVAEVMASPVADAAAPGIALSAPDLPSASFASSEPEAGDKPTGWDPIRVSSAWPVLKHTPTVAGRASNTSVPSADGDLGVTGAPWDAAPWAAGPADAAAPGTASSSAAGGGAPSHGGSRYARTAVVVIAAVILLCAIGVLVTVLA